MNQLIQIRNFLKEKSNSKARESWKKSIPTAEKIHGVYISEINKIVPEYKSGGFELVKGLWKSGYLEERILAAKILGKACKQNPELALKILEDFIRDVSDWAVCDTLATQGIRPIAKTKQKEIFKLSEKLVKSKNPWERRFGVVLLINFRKDKSLRKDIQNVIKSVEKDKEYYVKKAVEWIKRELK